MFPYSASVGQPGQNHNGQTDKTDYAGNVENLRRCAKLPLFAIIDTPHFRKIWN
jgi:hypothetical protein